MIERELPDRAVDSREPAVNHHRADQHERAREQYARRRQNEERPVLREPGQLHPACSLPRLFTERFSDGRLETLFSAESRVDDLPVAIEDDHVRGRGRVVRAGRFATTVEELDPGQLVLGHVGLHARRSLIHRDRDADKGDARAVLGVQRLDAGLELVTVAAPGGPELNDPASCPRIQVGCGLPSNVSTFDAGATCPDSSPISCAESGEPSTESPKLKAQSCLFISETAL